jgi:phosphoglycolate phosphatase
MADERLGEGVNRGPHYCLEVNSLDKRLAIMVGDRSYDIIGANKNEIDSIGVGYGYGTKEELLNSGPKYYFENVEEFRKAI